MTINLNSGQSAAKKSILTTINSPNGQNDQHRFHVFVGQAGTGKTTTTVQVIKSIPDHKTVCITAPTHKAVKVIRKMAIDAGIDDRVDIRTIHSCLGLKMTFEGDKEVLCVNDYAERTAYDVVFVDECSMLDEEIIGFAIDDNHIEKYIFIGDDYQCSPVNSEPNEISPVFTEVEARDDLLEIVRQAEGNPIIELATAFRHAQDDHFAGWPSIVENISENGDGVYVKPSWEWLQELIVQVKHGIEIGDGDWARAVAYTNDAVDMINDRVRKAIHGEDCEAYIVGEVLIANGGMDKKYANSEELRVLAVEEDYDEEYELDCISLKLVSLETNFMFHVRVIEKEHEPAFQNKLTVLAERAKQSKSLWREFWALKKNFGLFKYSHCSTIHKAQGSSWGNTFFYSPDVFHRGATLENKQLAYTAITRSRYRTVFAT